MAKQVTFEGKTYSFPDDATDDEIFQFLGGSQQPVAQDTPPNPDALPNQPAVPPQAPPAPERPPLWKLGVQGAARGIADLAGAPVDLTAGAMNAGLSIADFVSRGSVPFRFREPTFGSDSIANAASNVAGMFGYETETPQNFKEKFSYNTNRIGANAAVSAAGLAKMAAERGAKIATENAPKWYDTILRPYFQNPARTAQGDAAAGLGAGAALTASQSMPENVRNSGNGAVGAIGDYLAMLAGGVGAGTVYNSAIGGPMQVAQRVKGKMNAVDVPLDPETNMPTPNNVADQAARFVQSTAIDPQNAATNILRRTGEAAAENLPLPTSGLLSDDIGLQMLERGLRAKNSTGSILLKPDLDASTKAQFSFGARDTKLRDTAVDKVNSIRGEGDPNAFVTRAGEVADQRVDLAERNASKARGREREVQTALREPADDLNANIGRGTRASQEIDQMYSQTRRQERQQSHSLYNDPVLRQAEVPNAPLRQIAEEIQGLETAAAPLNPVIRKYTDRFAGAVDPVEGGRVGGLDPDQPLTMREVNAIRAELEADISANLSNAEIVTQLRRIKDVVNRYSSELAESGNTPAATAARAAEQNYAERIAPNFRQGAGGRMDTRLKNDPNRQNIQASQTAQEFLTTPEDAASLTRIAALRGNEQETAQAARSWLFDRLAQTGVAENGAINAEKLARWRNINGDILDQIPGLRAEVDQMVADAQRGNRLLSTAKRDVRTAETNADNVLKEVEKGPLGAVRDASPENAVKSIFASANPEQTARELVSTVGKNTEAKRGLKAAIADHFSSRVSGVNPANVSEGNQNINYSALVKEFQKNERVLAAVYSPEEMNALRQAQKLLEPLAKRQGQATTGSVTAESNLSAWRALEAGLKLKFGMLKGGGIMRSLKLVGDSLGLNDTANANRLVARMMFDPDLAAHLLTRKVEDVGSPAWNSQLQKLLRVEQVARDLNE